MKIGCDIRHNVSRSVSSQSKEWSQTSEETILNEKVESIYLTTAARNKEYREKTVVNKYCKIARCGDACPARVFIIDCVKVKR